MLAKRIIDALHAARPQRPADEIRLVELRDNTEDDLIVTQLTNGITAVKPTNLIDDLKRALKAAEKAGA